MITIIYVGDILVLVKEILYGFGIYNGSIYYVNFT